MALLGSYFGPVSMLTSASRAAGIVFYTMKAPEASFVYIRRIYLHLSFTGDLASVVKRSTGISLHTATGTTEATGGTDLVPIKKKSTYPDSALADLRMSTDGSTLTTTGLTVATGFATLSIGTHAFAGTPATNVYAPPAQQLHDLHFWDETEAGSPLVLGTNQFLVMKFNEDVITGFGLQGFVEWDERT